MAEFPTPPVARHFFGKPGARAPNTDLTRSVTVYEKATGKAHLVWPVDARQMVESGAFQLDPLAAEVTADTALAADARGTREKALRLMSADEVKAIASEQAIPYTNKGEAIKAILAAEFAE